MRRLFMSDEVSEAVLWWGERKERWRRVDRKVWADGPEELSPLDRARAAVMATGGIASHHLAGVLYGLDSVDLNGLWVTVPPTGNGRRPHVCRRALPAECVVRVWGLPCTDGMRTLADLAGSLSDAVWEQALESALRKRLTSIETVTGNRRVLAMRPAGAPPTESLLETLMVQLIRTVPALPEPVRQLGSRPPAPGWTWRGPSSGSSSSSTASTTRVSPSTTRAERRPWSPRPGGCVGDSPGTRSP